MSPRSFPSLDFAIHSQELVKPPSSPVPATTGIFAAISRSAGPRPIALGCSTRAPSRDFPHRSPELPLPPNVAATVDHSVPHRVTVAGSPQSFPVHVDHSAPSCRQLLHARPPHAAARAPQCHPSCAATTPRPASPASFHFSLQWPPPPSPSPATSAPEPPLSIPCSAPSLPLCFLSCFHGRWGPSHLSL